MVFYDKEGNKHTYNIEGKQPFDKGTQAKIYRISNTECLKVLNKDPQNYFNEDTYNTIRSLSLNGLVQLGIPFYLDGKIKAYTMEYLERSEVSILDMPTEYTLDNLNSLYKDMLVLTKNLILVEDLIHRNLIVGPSSVKIIDLDRYLKLSFDNDIQYANTWYLLYAFRRLFQEELISKNYHLNNNKVGDKTFNEYILYLFEYNGYKKEPAMVLERKMIGTRTPMELFNRKW